MRGGIPRAHAAVRHNSRNPQSSYNPAVLRQRRCPRQWAADIARGYRHSVGILPSPAAGECLMAAQRTRARPAGDWIGPPPSQARGPAVTAGLPVPAEDGGAIAVFQAQEFAARRRRVPVRLLSLVVVVLVPATLAAVYFFLIAADQYVAEFRFALRTVEPVRAEVGGLLQGSVAPSPVGVDSYAVVQYLGSRDVIDELGKTLDLREMFSRPEADWLTRLQLPVSIEELVRYWKSQVDAFYDITNGTMWSGPAPSPRRMRCSWRGGSSPRQSAWSTICRRGRGTTLCRIRRRKCAAPNGGSRRRWRGFASFATARASSIRAKLPTPHRRWLAGYATRSSVPTPNYPLSSITCGPTLRPSGCWTPAYNRCRLSSICL